MGAALGRLGRIEIDLFIPFGNSMKAVSSAVEVISDLRSSKVPWPF